MGLVLVLIIVISIGAAATAWTRRARDLASMRIAFHEMVRQLYPSPCSSVGVLERRVGRGVLATVSVGVGGSALVPTSCEVELASEDWNLVEYLASWLSADVEAWVEERLAGRGIDSSAPSVTFVHEASAVAGVPRVRASYGEPSRSSGPGTDIGSGDATHLSARRGGQGRRPLPGPWSSTAAGDDTVVARPAEDVAQTARRATTAVDTVEMRPEPLVLVGSDGSTVLRPEHRRTWVLGRGLGCDIQFDDPMVSKRHATVSWSAGRWFIQDMASGNGTFVDGQRVLTRTELGWASNVRLGQTLSLKVGRRAA